MFTSDQYLQQCPHWQQWPWARTTNSIPWKLLPTTSQGCLDRCPINWLLRTDFASGNFVFWNFCLCTGLPDLCLPSRHHSHLRRQGDEIRPKAQSWFNSQTQFDQVEKVCWDDQWPPMLCRLRAIMLIQKLTVRLSTSVPTTLQRGNWSRQSFGACQGCCTKLYLLFDQVQLPLPQRHPVQPAVLHLRLVVQRGLLAGAKYSHSMIKMIFRRRTSTRWTRTWRLQERRQQRRRGTAATFPMLRGLPVRGRAGGEPRVRRSDKN